MPNGRQEFEKPLSAEDLEFLKKDAEIIKKPTGKLIDWPKLKSQQEREDAQDEAWAMLGRTLREGEESGEGV